METIIYNSNDLIVLIPFGIVVFTALVVLLLGVFFTNKGNQTPNCHSRESGNPVFFILSIVGLSAAFIANLYIPILFTDSTVNIFLSQIAFDSFAQIFNSLVILGTGLAVLLIYNSKELEEVNSYEILALILLASSGMIIMIQGVDLISLFIGLEIASIASYALAGLVKGEKSSSESSIKYFLLGAFSSGLLLFGIAFIFGACSHTNIIEIARIIIEGEILSKPILLIGVGFLVVGFCFKIASVPFHMWTPDVYEGAPTSITAYFATLVKVASFAIFLRIFVVNFVVIDIDWFKFIWILAVLTMTIGNFGALLQNNIKRMLGYSSIAHAGYILIGFLLINADYYTTGASVIFFYLVAYTVMNLGAFGVVILISKKQRISFDIDSYRGVSKTSPFLAAVLTLFLISLAGIPPTGGFMAKFYVFSEAIRSEFYIIAIIGILNSLLSVYYYLRVIVKIYFEKGEGIIEITKSAPIRLSIIICAILILILGLFPTYIFTVLKQVQIFGL